MSNIRPLVKYNPFGDNSILTERIEAKDYSDPEARQALEELLRDNCTHYKGLGIAANQVGLVERVFYLDGKAYFNPEIVEYIDEGDVFAEGCLSFYSIKTNITRYSKIKVAYTTTDGDNVTETLEGLPAIAFQHEIDHLNGVTVLDRTKAKLSKDRLLTKIKKLHKKGK